MTTTKLSCLLSVLVFTAFPFAAGAISSTSFILDPSQNVVSIHKAMTSTSFNLDGSIDPIVGKSTSTSFKNESGDAFSYYCGDGFIDPGETCDGASMSGSTCVTQGFISGTLSCNSTCTALVTSSCSSTPPASPPAGGGGGGGGGGAAAPALSSVPVLPTLSSEISSKTFSYKSSLLLSGAKGVSTTSVVINNTTIATYPTALTWQAAVSLAFGLNTFKIVAKNDSAISSETTYSITRRLAGDATGDNVVNDYDLSKIAKLWGSKDQNGDFTEDGIVDDYDFSMMVVRWGTKI